MKRKLAFSFVGIVLSMSVSMTSCTAIQPCPTYRNAGESRDIMRLNAQKNAKKQSRALKQYRSVSGFGR